MPVALPTTDVDLNPPGADEVRLLSRGFIAAAAPAEGLSATQRLLIAATVPAMTGYPATFDGPTIDAAQFARGLSRRDLVFRSRIVQNMILLGLVLRPLPGAVAERISAFADELCVEDGMLEITREFATGALGLAAVDFDRNGYTAGWTPDRGNALHTSRALQSAWDLSVDDTNLAARWTGLEQLPPASLGRRVTELYEARGFVYPGLPGSAPPLLAQHDWVHVLADYGTTVEAELEVFAFIARANDDPHAFSLLAMVVSLFETGYLRAGAGLFEHSEGHLSESGMAPRIADALRRGALCAGSIDFLRTDWFALAHLTVDAARQHFGIPAKALAALEAGSVGPWETGGITPYQVRSGTALALKNGHDYDAYGAAPG